MAEGIVKGELAIDQVKPQVVVQVLAQSCLEMSNRQTQLLTDSFSHPRLTASKQPVAVEEEKQPESNRQ